MNGDQLELALALDGALAVRVRRLHPDDAASRGPFLWELDAVQTRPDLARLLRPVATVHVTLAGAL